MELLAAYIPADRREALGRKAALPDRTRGAALFADISGFTPLTEALSRTFGPRRGAEELTGHLNGVYDAIIAEVDRFGGSVIAFAGDAITCWFEGDNGLIASASALAMQAAMLPFAEVRLPGSGTVGLAVKAAVSSGPARRFMVGRPEIQVIDVVAGGTLAHMAAAGHAARRGEVMLDSRTVVPLEDSLKIVDWRADEVTRDRFAVVAALNTPVPTHPWPDAVDLKESVVRPWLIPAVYERLRNGRGEFLTELRPAAALFLKFEGIDYDRDDVAGQKLDAYVGWVQGVLARYEGFLIDVSIGDKGSYLYLAFGAPIAHENDAWRHAAHIWSVGRRRQPRRAFDGTRRSRASARERTGPRHGRERLYLGTPSVHASQREGGASACVCPGNRQRVRDPQVD